MTASEDRRIAKNTIFLYGRLLLTLGIQLYSSRIVLEMLGVSNYGIYNVVGGIIVIISFLNGTMAGATQRFLNYEMGRGTKSNLAGTFSAALLIHIVIAIIILILGETIGLWYVNHELVIPTERMYAANWVYQLSLIGAILTIMQIPYTASVIAHEQMGVFASLSLLSSFLKLGIALLLAFAGNFDTLILYAWLMLGVSAIIFISYFIYTRYNFKETIFTRSSRNVIRKLMTYSVSDLFGTLSYTLNQQGIIIILNRYGGTVLNAAGGITLTVSNSLSQFGSAIVTAFRPQIIKQYAAEQYGYMLKLMINCSKFASILFALIAIPAIINMETLLNIWLKEVPPYTTIFCQLTLMWSIGDLFKMTLCCGIHATGRIFRFSFITGLIFIIELPLMYLLLNTINTPWIIYIVHILSMGFLITATMIILHTLIPHFKIGRFIIQGIIIPMTLIIITFITSFYTSTLCDSNIVKLVITSCQSTVMLAVLAWIFALDQTSRAEVINFISNKVKHNQDN